MDYDVHVEQEVYQALIHASQSLPLLPSIKKLVWDNTSIGCLKSLFISPTLTILHLRLTGEDGSYEFSLFSLLTSLSLLCPSVSTLGLSADPRGMLYQTRKSKISMYTSAALSAFRNLMHLQRLELALLGMPENAFCNVIALNYLRSLRIVNAPPHGFQHPMPDDRKNSFFPHLEHLDISKCTIEFALWMLTNMWETPLKTLILDFTEPPTATNWTLFQTIHDQIPHHYLRVVDIGFDSYGTTDEVGLTMKQLSPLLSFTKLTRVSLCVCIALDDDAMTRIALAWPHLESLYLRDHAQALESSQSITFKGLADLARHCQALEDLCLPSIDATKMLPDPDNIPCNRKLVALVVQKSSIDDPSLVAALLFALFPNLQAIYAGEFTDQWTRVMESIRRNRDALDCPEAREN